MVVGLLGNESPDLNRFTLVTPKPENGVRLQATLGNQNPTGLPTGAVSWKITKIYINKEKFYMNDLKIFNNKEFGQIRTVEIDGKPYFVANDIAKALGYTNPSKATNDHCKKAKMVWGNDSLGRRQEFKVIPEGDMYRLVTHSKLESAERFESWVFDDVLPSIRKTGGYVNDDDLFINTYLPFADDTIKTMFKATLATTRHQNEIILKQKEEIANQKKIITAQEKEISHKDKVNKGLLKDIPLADKRQILNRVVRKGAGEDNIAKRWTALYREFEQKYHMNLVKRIEGYNDGCDEFNERNKDRIKSKEVTKRKKVKTRIEYIDVVLNQIPDLFDLACKLYENDVTVLAKELYNIINPEC